MREEEGGTTERKGDVAERFTGFFSVSGSTWCPKSKTTFFVGRNLNPRTSFFLGRREYFKASCSRNGKTVCPIKKMLINQEP
jgi:hypothetical protein